MKFTITVSALITAAIVGGWAISALFSQPTEAAEPAELFTQQRFQLLPISQKQTWVVDHQHQVVFLMEHTSTSDIMISPSMELQRASEFARRGRYALFSPKTLRWDTSTGEAGGKLGNPPTE